MKEYTNKPLENIIVFRSGPPIREMINGLDYSDNADDPDETGNLVIPADPEDENEPVVPYDLDEADETQNSSDEN